MPTTTWFNLAAAKRERIIEAALAEFGARGFSAGSLNVIAREAGVAKGSLFQYFGDKRALYAHVCEVCSRRIRDDLATSMVVRADDEHDLFAFLRALLVDWVAYMRSHPLERAVTFAANFEIDPAARAAVRDVTNRYYLQVLRPLVEAAADAGQLRPGVSVDHLLALLLLIVPHLATAPFADGLDPVLHMQRDGIGLPSAVTGFVDALEAAFGARDGRPPVDLLPVIAGATAGAAAGA